jgi:hypothetical protein
VKYYHKFKRSSSNVPVILVTFNGTLIFSTDFRKNLQISKFTKSRPVEVKLFRADGRTETQTEGQTHRRTDREGDMIQLRVALGNFVNAQKNGQMGQKHAVIYKNIK